MESYILIILISIIIIYKYFNRSDVIYLENTKNKNLKEYYLVRNVDDKYEAMKILISIKKKLKELINKLLVEDTKSEMHKYVKQIANKIDKVEIQESTADSQFTSYSVNKGDILVFCIRSKNTLKIHDINDLLYVAIHEIAHIGCPEIGHTDLFFKINKYLLKKAIGYNIYNYIDYKINKREYCGMELNVSIAT